MRDQKLPYKCKWEWGGADLTLIRMNRVKKYTYIFFSLLGVLIKNKYMGKILFILNFIFSLKSLKQINQNKFSIDL